MQHNRSRKRAPLIFYVAILLMAATLVTTHLSSGLLARYVTRSAGEDTARVATFRITDSVLKNGTESFSYTISELLSPEDVLFYRFTIENDSEVAVRCLAAADNPLKNLPLLFSLQQGGAPKTEVIIAPGDQAVFDLHITWNSEDKSPSHGGKVDTVKFTVTVEQID